MNKYKIDFWIGSFANLEAVSQFFREQYDDEDKPLSRFAESQGESWIDHDFLEFGFEDGSLSIKDKFQKYSYSEHWLETIENLGRQLKINEFNAIVMCFYDEDRSQINNPKSFFSDKYNMKYVGVIEFDSEW